MLSSQEEQAERRRVLANDARVREQAGTFMSHTHTEIGGRYSNVGAQTIVGQTANPYPAASAPFQCDPVPDEPSLGYSVEAMPEHEPLEPLSPAQGHSGDLTSDAPPGTSQRDVGSPLSYRRVR
jgi:hypothetical protein